ncbi:MAG: hypothetical protein P8Y67_04330 [Alphaproteobacteria bacterium]
MEGYKVTCVVLCCWISLTAIVMANIWDLHSYIGMNANATTLSPVRHRLSPNPMFHLVQNGPEGFQVKDASGPAGKAIPLQIQLPLNAASKSGDGTKYTFLMFRGLPSGFKLSSGISTKNSYIVSIEQHDNLLIIPAENFSGTFALRVLLYNGNNSQPIERVANISIGVSNKNAANNPSSTGSMDDSVHTRTSIEINNNAAKPKISPDDEASSLEQANQFIKSGNIAFARLIYEDLALQGSARGAFALGQTYDPAFLIKKNVVSLQPDIKTAKKWYRKAAEMGDQSAAKRLNIIEGEGY